MTIRATVHQGYEVHIDRPMTVYIPNVREGDALQMVRDWLMGRRPSGADWSVTVDDPQVTVATLVLTTTHEAEEADQ